jgi:hypothetical protein
MVGCLLAWVPSAATRGVRSAAAAAASASGEHTGEEEDEEPLRCERCARPLTDLERRWNMELCDGCYDTWFRHFKRRTLMVFCGVAALLEISMNATVVATFQPIAVEHFGWGSNQIAMVYRDRDVQSLSESLTHDGGHFSYRSTFSPRGSPSSSL